MKSASSSFSSPLLVLSIPEHVPLNRIELKKSLLERSHADFQCEAHPIAFDTAGDDLKSVLLAAFGTAGGVSRGPRQLSAREFPAAKVSTADRFERQWQLGDHRVPRGVGGQRLGSDAEARAGDLDHGVVRGQDLRCVPAHARHHTVHQLPDQGRPLDVRDSVQSLGFGADDAAEPDERGLRKCGLYDGLLARRVCARAQRDRACLSRLEPPPVKYSISHSKIKILVRDQIVLAEITFMDVGAYTGRKIPRMLTAQEFGGVPVELVLN